jgi:ABC-type sugar transport system substrate-binding protein
MSDLTDEQKARVEHLFTYQPPKPQDIEKYTLLRKAAKDFAEVLLTVTPSCADQSSAIRAIREAVAWGNAAIALEGKS